MNKNTIGFKKKEFTIDNEWVKCPDINPVYETNGLLDILFRKKTMVRNCSKTECCANFEPCESIGIFVNPNCVGGYWKDKMIKCDIDESASSP